MDAQKRMMATIHVHVPFILEKTIRPIMTKKDKKDNRLAINFQTIVCRLNGFF
jgi:hypothetical protein